MPCKKLRFAVVCSSNMNRSMEAHRFMSKKGFDVQSFGSGNQVKLPGQAADKPNVFSFDWRYDDIYNKLKEKDPHLFAPLADCLKDGDFIKSQTSKRYTQNGVLNMLDRNRRIKERPQRFQDCPEKFDIIITLEERVYDQVMEDFNTRESEEMQPVHVINFNIQDNHEEATIGAFVVGEFAKMMQDSSDLDNEIDELLQEFEEKTKRQIMHSVHFY